MTDHESATCRLQCADRDCSKHWNGDDLAQIARNVAWHWNKEHNDELQHGTKRKIDEIERGGHHVHGNEYTVERVPIYLTSFDVMERIGAEDGYAVASEATDVCKDCLKEIEDTDEAELLDDSYPWKDEYRCSECQEERELERKKAENQQLTEFPA